MIFITLVPLPMSLALRDRYNEMVPQKYQIAWGTIKPDDKILEQQGIGLLIAETGKKLGKGKSAI